MISKSPAFRITLLLIILLGLIGADLLLGSVRIPLRDVFKILTGGESKASWTYILLNVRLPKTLTALLVGAGLSLAGLMMQTLFRNPLAGPFVLGISSGASLGVALLVMASVWTGGTALTVLSGAGQWSLVLASVLGSTLVMLLVILVSLRVADSVSVLIIGIMFGSVTGAAVSVLQYFSDPDAVHSFLVWTFGSISGVTWTQFRILAPLVTVCILAAFLLQKPLNALLLGERQARAIGVSVKRNRLTVILVTGVMAGVITAFTGPIAFIGVAVPHLARALTGTSDHRLVSPVTALSGSILLLVCDMIAQLPLSNQVLPINSVTAIFGAPVVIWMIVKNRRGQQIFQ